MTRNSPACSEKKYDFFFLKKKIAATMHSLVELHINIREHQHSNGGKISGVTVFKHGLTKLREYTNLREQQVTHY